MKKRNNATVVDLFCGAGGMTRGFLDAGLQVVAGVDSDPICKYPYETNNDDASFVEADLFELKSSQIEVLFASEGAKILIGCAPCQPFSKYANTKKRGNETSESDNRWKLVQRFGEIIGDIRPEIVSMENVPDLRSFRKGRIFQDFLDQLKKAGYKDENVTYDTLYCPDYGVPQTRKRLVLLASKLGPISLPEKTHYVDEYPTVGEVIKDLPLLKSGETDPEDLIHRARNMSSDNIKRIQHSKPGGTWLDWPEELRLPCHRKESGKSYNDVYGRMQWDAPAPTLTTQFFNYGTGRFGHPEQDRPVSFREGALLQTFPRQYLFDHPKDPLSNVALGRLIGNAVPVKLAEAIAKAIIKHLDKYHV